MNIRRILVPTDFSACSADAAAVAADLAKRLGAAVEVAAVVEAGPLMTLHGLGLPLETLDRIEAATRKELDGFVTQHFSAAERVARHVVRGNTYCALAELARNHAADLVVMGTHGRTGVGRLLMGSTAEKMVAGSPVPVMTVRRRSPPIKRILAAIDFSDQSLRAAEWAAGLACRLDAALDFLHVVELPGLWPGVGETVVDADRLTRLAAADLDKLVAERFPGPNDRLVVTGSPAHEILHAAASREAGLVVMGTSGRSGLARLLLGSVAAKVVRTGPAPVLTVREESNGAVDDATGSTR